jgi:hypothetical protein
MADLTIKTAKTKERRDIHLVSRVLEAETGEPVVALLRIDGREKETEHFVHEWVHTVERTLVHSDDPIYERLEGALKELNGLMKAVQISDHIREVNAILAIQGKDNVLHVSQAGRAEGYLMRSGTTSQITERSPGKANPQFLYISNGDLRSGDVVLLSTERVLRCMTPPQLAQAGRDLTSLLSTVSDALEGEKEAAAFAMLSPGSSGASQRASSRDSSSFFDFLRKTTPSISRKRHTAKKRGGKSSRAFSMDWGSILGSVQKTFQSGSGLLGQHFKTLQSDLQHPTRKRRAHLLLLAGAIVVFVGIWSGFQATSVSRRSQGRDELRQLVEKVDADITTAENRQLMGDIESANSLLNRAEEQARKVMQNESGLFRTDALDLLDRIREKRESINNIVRLTPTIVANLSGRNSSVSARGLIGIERGRSIVYDRQNLYSIIVNAVDEPQRLDGENLILDGVFFDRFGTVVFMTKENRMIELIEGQPTAMKTDDPAGWLTGPDMETYIRFLYLLSPQNNQILKYERLSNRYSEPTEYNVNGDLTGALDMAIDSDIYVLKPGGEVVKLFRGEQRNFSIRNLPAGALDTATKIFKPSDRGNLYFLDPEGARVIVSRSDDSLGESLYLKQYVLEGEQIGTLQDLYVDGEETQLLILDEKRLYSVNLQEG